MKKFLLLFLTLGTLTGFAQEVSINDYRYVIVPRKYDFQRFDNQYRLNTLTKVLLNEEGFEVYFDGEEPGFLRSDQCLALHAILENNSNVFTTKVVFKLLDCSGDVIAQSEEGFSKIKEFEPSYHEAFRRAFESISAMEYTYIPKAEVAENTAEDIEKPEVVRQEEAAEAAVVTEVNQATSGDMEEELPVLYAQPVDGGYQLVDTTPAVRFVIKPTTRPDTYTLKGSEGLVYRLSEDTWALEYYKEGELVQEKFRIKF